MSTGTIDAAAVRKDFPALHREVHGRPLVYLDSAATSQKPRAVVDAMARYYEESNANVHRGVHALADEATEAYESARRRVARFVGADPRGVVFTKNATEAVNVVAHAYARDRLGPGDVVLTTEMEHHANLVPWQLARDAAGFELRHVPVADGHGGDLDLDAFAREVDGGRVRLLAVTAMSNVTGAMPPVADMAARVRTARDDAVVLVDGSQSVPHLPTGLAALGADLLVFSGHKMLGPTGIGCLVGDPALLDAMPPFLAGGEMIADVRLDGSTFNEVPYRFEAGTPPIAEAVGLGAAVDYLTGLGMDAVRAHEVALLEAALPALAAVPGVTVHGSPDPAARGAAVSFAVGDLHPHDVGTILDREGVAVRAGHHCAKPYVRRLAQLSGARVTVATTRASFALYNTVDEVAALVEGLGAVRRFLRR